MCKNNIATFNLKSCFDQYGCWKGFCLCRPCSQIMLRQSKNLIIPTKYAVSKAVLPPVKYRARDTLSLKTCACDTSKYCMQILHGCALNLVTSAAKSTLTNFLRMRSIWCAHIWALAPSIILVFQWLRQHSLIQFNHVIPPTILSIALHISRRVSMAYGLWLMYIQAIVLEYQVYLPTGSSCH